MINSLDEFIDIHAHILPGLDDGAQNVLESLAMARLYEAARVKRVIATPHYLPGTRWANSKEQILESVHDLQMRLNEENVRLQVSPGMEIGFHKKMAERILNKSLLPLADSGYYLIEPSFSGAQDELLASLKDLLQMNQKLILAHPERVGAFQQKPYLLKSLVDKGLLIQVNTGSLLGRFGQKSQLTAMNLYRTDLIHFIASDAHDLDSRPPFQEKDYKKLQETEVSYEIFKLCLRNIATIFPKAS